ncbi:MAG: hypothetical protein GPJ54_07840 [Candidatus Heimdallarchaeota archaeon]|nr:hypothetical protein [Candidatus Heimdallarchaeota archaeon]
MYIMRDGWFNKFLGRIDDDEIYDELMNYETQEDDEEFYKEFIQNNKETPEDWGFDDHWLTKDFLEKTYEDHISRKSLSELGLILFEGDFYLSISNTQHLADLSYSIQHSN